MNASLRQSERLGRLTTALGPDVLSLLRFDGTDHLNELYDYRVEALAVSDDLDFDALIGIVAGGDPANFLRIGPHRENRIMGSQWAQGQGVQGGDRLNRLDAHAARLQANGCQKMNARLRVCPGRGMDAEGKPL